MKTSSDKEMTLALARASVYKLLSQALLYPDAEFYELVASGQLAAELEACWEHIQPKGKLPAGVHILRQHQPPDSLETLQEEYVGLFSHTVKSTNSPYEAMLGRGQAHVFQQTQCLADIAGFYRAFGLEIALDANERPDHIGIELEFMHFLACQEAHALKEDGLEEVTLVRQAQRDFLTEHLACWAPYFLKHIEEESVGLNLGVVQVTQDFLQDECSRLKVEPAQMGFDDPVAIPGDDVPLCMSGSPHNPEEDFS